MTEGTILEWHVKVGDSIKLDETIVEISTDKVDVELPSPATGTVSELLVAEGDTVTVGQVIARISVEDGADGNGSAATRSTNGAATDGAEKASAADGGAGDGEAPAAVATDDGAAAAASPEIATGELVDVLTPAAGESVTEGTILEWRAEVGDAITRDATIVEISTDKVDVELPAPASGTIAEILVAEGETVTVGQVIARIAVGRDGAAADRPAAPAAGAPATGDAAGQAGQAPASSPAPTGGEASVETPAGVKVSPVAARAAAAKGVDLEHISGSGPAGRITKSDVLAAADRGAGNGAATLPATAGGEAETKLLRGGAAALARYMTQSLGIPTATSFRTLPVTVLDARRQELKAAGRRVSFTHLIAYAIAQAAEQMPVMRDHYQELEGKSHRVRDDGANLGIAVDVEKTDGTRTLMVPVIRGAGRMPFASFVEAYDEIIEKARHNRLAPDDLAGANITLTNPGGLGTVASVPRLMAGQGTIVASGSIDYPVGLQQIGEMIGAEKVVTMTSTYDHRIIQGAESGRFLGLIEERLRGEHGFYEQVFEALGVELGPPPLPPAPAAAAAAARAPRTTEALPTDDLLDAVHAATIYVTRVRSHGHLAAHLDPLGSEPEGDPGLDPQALGLTPEIQARLPASIFGMYVPGATLADALPHLTETYCGTIAYEVEHIASHRQRVWLREHIESGAFRHELTSEERTTLLKRLVEVDALERFMHKAYLGQHQFSIEGLDMTVPMLDELIQLAAAHGGQEVVVGMAHRGRLNVLAHNLGRAYDTIFAEFEGASTLEAVTTIPQGGTGDVKYHHGTEGTYELPGGGTIRVNLESNPSHLEYVSPVVEGATRAAQTSRHGPHAHQDTNAAMPIVIHGDASFPGPGGRLRDAQPAGAGRLQGRRHRPRDHEQPDRLHDRPRRRPLDALGLGSREGLRRADHPRQRRRRARLRERRAPGLRLPQGVRPRRPDRPDRLSPLRAQRVRRARLHAARDVRQDQEQEARRGAVVRPSGLRRRHHPRGGRPSGPGGVGQPHQPPPASEGQDHRRRRRRGARHRRVPARPLAEPRSRDLRAGGAAALTRRVAAARARTASPSTPSSSNSWTAAARRSPETPPSGASTGPTPRRSRSRPCSPRAPPSASPDRTPSAAPSASATWSSTTPRTARRCVRSRTSRTRMLPWSCTTARCPSSPAWASSTATARRPPRRSCCGRPSSATSSTPPR